MVGSTSPTHKNSHQFSHKKQKTGSSEGSRFSAAERGYRTRPQQPLLGVLQQTASCAKENGRSSSSDRSVHSEQVLGGTSFPDGNGSDSLPRVDSIDRHKGHISSRSHESIHLKISPISCQQQVVSIYMSPVWTGHLSKGIHQDTASSCPVASNARGSSSCVFGRLADLGGFTRVGEFPCAASDDSAAPSRMDHKSGEVRTDTQTRV